MDIKEEILQEYKYTVNNRKILHQIPEIGWSEYETTKFIRSELDKLNISYTLPLKTGVVAEICGKYPGKTLGIRADIDALPIQEKVKSKYCSQNNGKMHACGHDGHAAALITCAKILSKHKDQINGKIKLIFQPSEEYLPSGAEALFNTNSLNDCDSIIAIHLRSDILTGKISIEGGPRMAASAGIDIHLTGKNCHAATPHKGIDSTIAGAALIMNLQTIVSREISSEDSVVISIGKFESGTEKNIISGDAHLLGTIRYYSSDLFNEIRKSIIRICKGIAITYRVKAKVEIKEACSEVVNNEALVKIGQKGVKKIFGEDVLISYPKSSLNEDFSNYAKICPILYILVGSGWEDERKNYPHHNEKFQINDESLIYAVGAFVSFALEYLKL